MEEFCEEEEPPGSTPFLRAVNLERNLRLKKFFIKFEGANATGSQKDRISKLHVLRAKRLGYRTISLATCGNYGASISYYAKLYGLNSVVAMPQDYSHERAGEILANGSEVLELSGKYEDTVSAMRDMANDNAWYDSSPGSANSDLDIMGYEKIAYEIVQQLGHSPKYLAIPVGNGTTLSGVFNGFVKMYNHGSIDSLPALIASSTANGNPIVYSWKRQIKRVVDLNPSILRESSVNEPLISYKAFDGQKALNAIYRSKGYAEYVTDEEMIRYARTIEMTESVQALPASASTLAAAVRIMSKRGRDSECVLVITGRNRLWVTQ
ncbi:MAG: pyridoxal-phosphate dependent enzyme [Thermoplasmataceae archaeon]